MLSVNKTAKFFCENCGAEVPENAKLCKNCGKFFISVRCPACGKVGTSSEFKKGCPGCGYAVNKKSFPGASTSDKAKALAKLFSSARNKSAYSARKIQHESSLPVWVYAVTFATFIAVMIGVYSCIKTPLY